jgi:hypothetical protein
MLFGDDLEIDYPGITTSYDLVAISSKNPFNIVCPDNVLVLDI